jgi:hypothetical protein
VDQIEEQSQGVSLMPEGLVDSLTDDEIAAVVRFLSELGRTPDYTLSKQRLVRSWQVMMPTNEAYHQLNRTSFSQAIGASNITWNPRYTTVAGVLPLDVMPTMKVRDVNVGFARFTISVTTPGRIAFRLNSVAGTEVRVDGLPMDPVTEFSQELTAGLHTIVLTIDTGKRSEPVQLELLNNEGGGNAELVN